MVIWLSLALSTTLEFKADWEHLKRDEIDIEGLDSHLGAAAEDASTERDGECEALSFGKFQACGKERGRARNVAWRCFRIAEAEKEATEESC